MVPPLRAIAADKPTTHEALLDVEGVGPRRLEEYGDAIVGLVREYLQQ
jgi:hypothetical protein